MAFAQPYGYYQPPPKKRGLKRIIFGGLGIVANTIGLFVMPVVLLLIASVVSVLTGGELHELGPEGRSFRAEGRSEEHTSELQSRGHLVCRLLLEIKKKNV